MKGICKIKIEFNIIGITKRPSSKISPKLLKNEQKVIIIYKAKLEKGDSNV